MHLKKFKTTYNLKRTEYKFEFVSMCRSVYSVGCGLGGKLGHGVRTDLGIPRSIEHFQTLNAEPLSISAGGFHCAATARDGRVFTWGWSNFGCLGHDDVQDCITVPTSVSNLEWVKARHVSAGFYSTFVVAESGHVYSSGLGRCHNLGVQV